MFFKTLPASAQRIFAQLGGESSVRSFYLAGGSACALHLGHRISVDLDFFTPEMYEPAQLIPRLESIGKITVQQQSRGTFVGLLAETQVSFFYYGYPLLTPPQIWRGVRIASLRDIALMKITAISQRGRKRDFVDLYFICREQQLGLSDLLKQIPDKYPTLSYPSYHLLRALTFFDDAEKDAPPKMLARYNWQQVKRFFEKQSATLMQEL